MRGCWTVSLVLVEVVVCVSFLMNVVPILADPSNPAKGYWLDSYVTSHNARCIDGSPVLYYYRPATNPINETKWVIHQQGGAWCVSVDDCWKRSKSRLGSSSSVYGWEGMMDFGNIPGCNNSRWCGGLFLNDPTKNPLTYDWNAVFIVYCDGGSQIGNNDTVTLYNGDRLYFVGFHNLDAVITDLLVRQGMSRATEVIVGGDSAGGLSTWIHTDYWASRLSAATRVVGVPDSGFFVELSSSPTHYVEQLEWVFAQMNGTLGVHPGCARYYAASDEVYQCVFAQNTAPFMQSSTFALQSQYDQYQIDVILHSTDATAVNAFGEGMRQLLEERFLTSTRNALFLDSCVHHCGGWGMGQDDDYRIVVDGLTAYQAFVQWYTGATERREWRQTDIYPCTQCCTGGGGK